MQLTEQTLNDIASLKDAAGVLSIFVDASPDRQIGEPPALEVSVRQALKKLVEEVHTSGPRERWKALTERLDELEPELNRLLSNGESGRGRALFAGIGGGPVRSLQLQVPLREAVVLDEHAHLSPLVAALDGAVCVGIVIAQRDGVRAIDVRLGEAEEVERFSFDPNVDYEGKGGGEGPGTNIGSAKEEFDQFLSENRHRFLRSVGERLGPVAERRGWNPIVLAGDGRLTSQLDAVLKKPGRELQHSERTPGDYASPGEVLRTFADDLDELRIEARAEAGRAREGRGARRRHRLARAARHPRRAHPGPGCPPRPRGRPHLERAAQPGRRHPGRQRRAAGARRERHARRAGHGRAHDRARPRHRRQGHRGAGAGDRGARRARGRRGDPPLVIRSAAGRRRVRALSSPA